MIRMSGYDAQFIYDEDQPNEPQHTLKISFLGKAASRRFSLAAARRDLAARLPYIEPLNWRAVRVPLDLDHPVWVRAPVDLRWHVRRMAVPAPGGHDELCEAISEILSRPLDRDRPLWEQWWLEGYEGGVVSVLKISHALADGSASRRLMEWVHGDRPVGDLPASSPEPLPSRRRLVVDALRDRWRALRRGIPALVRATHRARRRPAEPDASPLSLLNAPRHPLSGPLSSRRAFHFFRVPLAEAQEIRRALGGTVNDVVAAAVVGGVRRWLMERGALPGVPTVGGMPVSIRTAEEAEQWGNRVAAHFVRLPTQLSDPVERLQAVQQESARVKREAKRLGGAHLEDWIRWLGPGVAKAPGRLSRVFVRRGGRLPGIVSLTSVRGPGPDERWQSAWGPVEHFASVGHMKYSAGLNSTTWSYAGQLNFAFYACARAVPDLPRLSAHVAAAFEELRKCAARELAQLAA
ncbi:MAG: wax ester/triacylglycerol synthase family O-acyltransferase, partial [Myxococcota bacterium]